MAQGLDGAEYAFLPHEVRCMGFSTDVNQLSNAMANRFRCSGWQASRPLPGEWKVHSQPTGTACAFASVGTVLNVVCLAKGTTTRGLP